MKLITTVYRSKRHEGMYLYVDKKEDIARVPEALLERFGQRELAMTLLITPEKQLANVTGEKVIQAISQQGFYLQMPPLKDKSMLEIASKNSKLSL